MASSLTGGLSRRALHLALLGFLVPILLAVAFEISSDPSPQIKSSFLKVGGTMPSLRAAKLGSDSDETISLDDMRGRVWLLNIWASWCGPCRLEHPQVSWLSEQGLTVIGLNHKDSERNALDWLEENRNPYMFSLADSNGDIGHQIGVYGIPETFLIDRSGVVLHRHIGPMLESDAKEILGKARDG